jgi:hypothetical protein
MMLKYLVKNRLIKLFKVDLPEVQKDMPVVIPREWIKRRAKDESDGDQANISLPLEHLLDLFERSSPNLKVEAQYQVIVGIEECDIVTEKSSEEDKTRECEKKMTGVKTTKEMMISNGEKAATNNREVR